MLNRGGNSWPWLAVEALMLVVGINVALWFEGRFEDLRESELEDRYLAGLHEELLTDRDTLASAIEWNREKTERLSALSARLDELPDAPGDEQARAIWEVSGYTLFTPTDYTWQSMQESGDFRLLSDPQLKRDLLRLMRRYRDIQTLQTNFLQALDDEYIPLMMRSFDLRERRVTDPDLLRSQMFRNSVVYAAQDTGDRVVHLERAQSQVEALIAQLEGRLPPEAR